MRYAFTTLLLVLGLTLTNAQAWRSSSIIQGTGDITIIQAKSSVSGNVYVLGHFLGTIAEGTAYETTSYGGRDYFIGKFDADGILQWIKYINSPLHVYIYGGIGVDESDNVYVAGGYRNYIKYSSTDSISSVGAFDSFLAKYDVDGNEVFLNPLGVSAYNVRPSSLKIDRSGDILISGFFTDSVQFASDMTLYSTDAVDDYFLTKFDPASGTPIYAKQIKGIDNPLSGRVFDIDASDDSYYLAGLFADSIGFENDTIVSMNNSLDVHLIKTDLTGNVQWIRKITGMVDENSWSVSMGLNDDIYIAGWYDSPLGIFADSTDTETVSAPGSNGSDDIFLAKYVSDGTLQWIRTAGGAESDKVFDMVVHDNLLHVSGYFTGSMNWGGVLLNASTATDQDMFVGSMSLDGEFRSANATSGKTGEESSEEARAIFYNNADLLTVIATNTTQLELEDGQFYFNPGATYFVAVGVIGCLPISIDNVFPVNVLPCYGDSTGTIQVVAGLTEPGFGTPYTYSIDNGETGSASPFFNSLPAGSYQVVVTDAEGCSQEGPVVELTQPAEIIVSAVDSSDVLCNGENTGSISITASGGNGTLVFSADSANWTNVGTAISVGTGSYELYVRDENECVKEAGTATISEPEALTINTDAVIDAPCFGEEGSIEISAAGGTGAYEYTLDAATFVSDTVIAAVAGEYTPSVRDENGCITADNTVSINEPEELDIILVSSENIIVDEAGSALVSITGGTPNYSYYLLNTSSEVLDVADTSATFVIDAADAYYIKVVDSNACADSVSVTIDSRTNFLAAADGKFYPNPSNGNITLEVNTDKAEVLFRMFSLEGKEVKRMTLYAPNRMINETIDLTSMDPGVYVIMIDNKPLANPVIIK